MSPVNSLIFPDKIAFEKSIQLAGTDFASCLPGGAKRERLVFANSLFFGGLGMLGERMLAKLILLGGCAVVVHACEFRKNESVARDSGINAAEAVESSHSALSSGKTFDQDAVKDAVVTQVKDTYSEEEIEVETKDLSDFKFEVTAVGSKTFAKEVQISFSAKLPVNSSFIRYQHLCQSYVTLSESDGKILDTYTECELVDNN